jgi:hypothetical protein
MTIVCTNTTSAHSFLYHIPGVKNYERSSRLLPTPMGNIRQTITWTEPIEDARFEKYIVKGAKR